MRLTAVTNHKGGSAKTTTVVNVAAALSELGQRVLVIDMDPQGSATNWLGRPLADRSVLDVYLARGDLLSIATRSTAPGVDLVPSSPWLVAADRSEEIAIGLGIIGSLERLPDEWDYVLVDCPPTQGSLAVAPLAVCQHVVVPVETRVLALTGLVSLIGTMDAIRERLNPTLMLDAIIASRVNWTRHAREIVERLRDRYGGTVLQSVVRESIALAEAPSFELPITLYAPDGVGAEDYRSVAVELLERDERAKPWTMIPVPDDRTPTFRLDRPELRRMA